MEAAVVDYSIEPPGREIQTESVAHMDLDGDPLAQGTVVRRPDRAGREVHPMALEALPGKIEHVRPGSATHIEDR